MSISTLENKKKQVLNTGSVLWKVTLSMWLAGDTNTYECSGFELGKFTNFQAQSTIKWLLISLIY